jgi:hypothetical protein
MKTAKFRAQASPSNAAQAKLPDQKLPTGASRFGLRCKNMLTDQRKAIIDMTRGKLFGSAEKTTMKTERRPVCSFLLAGSMRHERKPNALPPPSPPSRRGAPQLIIVSWGGNHQLVVPRVAAPCVPLQSGNLRRGVQSVSRPLWPYDAWAREDVELFLRDRPGVVPPYKQLSAAMANKEANPIKIYGRRDVVRSSWRCRSCAPSA